MNPPKPLNTLTFFSLTFNKRRMTKSEKTNTNPLSVEEAIIELLSKRSSATSKELSELSGLSRSAITSHLRTMIANEIVEPTEPARSPKQRYRLAGK